MVSNCVSLGADGRLVRRVKGEFAGQVSTTSPGPQLEVLGPVHEERRKVRSILSRPLGTTEPHPAEHLDLREAGGGLIRTIVGVASRCATTSVTRLRMAKGTRIMAFPRMNAPRGECAPGVTRPQLAVLGPWYRGTERTVAIGEETPRLPTENGWPSAASCEGDSVENVPLPKCPRCETDEFVEELGPDFLGTEYRCDECGHHWVEQT